VPRCVAEGAEAQLLKDNLIDTRPICLVRDQALDAVLVRQPSAVEILFHGVAGAEQRHTVHARCGNGTPGGVGDMQER